MSTSSNHGFSQINNLGVTCLEDGKYQQAQNLLRLALTQLSAEMRVKKQPEHEGIIESRSNNINNIRPLPNPLERSFLIDQLQHRPTDNNDDLIYARGIRMTDPTINGGESFSSDPFEDYKLRSAIIVFNLGLVCHLGSLKEDSPSILHKANILYQKSYQILLTYLKVVRDKSTTERITLTGNALIDILYMALCNNLSQTHLELRDYNNHNVWLNQLILCVHTIPTHYDRATEHEQVSSFMSQQMNYFLLNAVLYRFYPKSVAAAA